MNFYEMLEILKKETENLTCNYGSHSMSRTSFIFYDRWNNEFTISQIARFLVEGKNIDQNDITENGEQQSQLSIDIEPIEFDEYGNCEGDFCISPKIIFSKIKDGLILVDIYDTIGEDDFKLINSIEFNLDIKSIKNSIEYKITKGIKKSNNAIAYEIKQVMLRYDINKFHARQKLIDRYGQKNHAKLTWIMYNLLEV